MSYGKRSFNIKRIFRLGKEASETTGASFENTGKIVGIRKAALKFKEAVHYEKLKESIAERRARLKLKVNFLFPFRSDRPLKESVEEFLEKFRGKKNQ